MYIIFKNSILFLRLSSQRKLKSELLSSLFNLFVFGVAVLGVFAGESCDFLIALPKEA